MGFTDAIQTCMGKYATFSGRASRSEFWWYYLFVVVLTWFAKLVAAVTMPVMSAAIFQMVISLAFFVPTIAAASRRLHDSNRSGWWQLLSLTVIGIIPVIYWLAKSGDSDANSYGPRP